MVDAVEVSSIKIDTGYAGKKHYSFFARTDKNGQTLPDARCAIVLGKNGSGKSTIARGLKGKIIVLNSLIRMEINLKVIVQIFIFLMNDLYISIFFQNKTIFCRKGYLKVQVKL